MLGVVKCCWQLIWVCVLTLRDVGDHVRGLPGLVKTWSCEGDLTLGPQRYCEWGTAPSLWRGLAAFVFHSVVAALSMGTPIGSEPSDCRGGKEGRDAETCPPVRPPKSLWRTVCMKWCQAVAHVCFSSLHAVALYVCLLSSKSLHLTLRLPVVLDVHRHCGRLHG